MLRAAACQRMLAGLLGTQGWCSSSSSSRSITALQTQQAQQGSSGAAAAAERPRHFASAAADGGDYTHEVDAINEKFVEAREEIEYAREDAETVYFNESAETARAAVADVLQRWGALLERLPAEEQSKLQRSMGLKIEQLKAELKEMDELHA